MIGGGEGFRFVVKPAQGVSCPDMGAQDPLCPVQDIQDTVRGVPAIGGIGGGVHFEATKHASLVAEVHGLVGFPVVSIVADFNLGLQFNFYSETEAATPGRYVPKEEDEEPK
jgi:hypothetical protein